MGHLERAGRKDVLEVFKHCKNLAQHYGRRRFGMKEGALGRHVTTLPIEVLSDPEYRKYLDPNIPYEDRAKEIDRLLKRLDWFDFRKHG